MQETYEKGSKSLDFKVKDQSQKQRVGSKWGVDMESMWTKNLKDRTNIGTTLSSRSVAKVFLEVLSSHS